MSSTKRLKSQRAGTVLGWALLGVLVIAVLLIWFLRFRFGTQVVKTDARSSDYRAPSAIPDRPIEIPQGAVARTTISETGSRRWELHVLDAMRVPVPGATIKLKDPADSGKDLVALTDEFGTTSIEVIAEAAALDVSVEAQGFLRRELELVASEPSIEIILLRDSRGGIVCWRETEVGVPGVNVVAYNSSGPPPSPQEYVERSKGFDFAVVQTDENGRFEFVGLDRNCGYLLCAGAPGIATPQLIGLPSTGQDARLEVARAYGAIIHLDLGANTGEGPSEDVRSAIRIRNTLAYPDAQPLASIPLVAALAGIPFDAFGPNSGLTPYVALADVEVAAIGPCYLKVFAPGYADASTEYHLNRLDLGAQAIHVTLLKVSTSSATLEILPIGLSAELKSRLLARPCQLELSLRASNAQREDRYKIELNSDAPIELAGIPEGEYRVDVRSTDSVFAFDIPDSAKPLVVIGHTILTLDLSTAGVIEFQFPRDAAAWGSRSVSIILADSVIEDANGKKKYRNSKSAEISPSSPFMAPCTPGTYILKSPDLTQEQPNMSKVQTIIVPASGTVIVNL